MAFKIRTKLALAVIAAIITSVLSIAIIRHLVAQDFRDFIEGSIEDRVYWVTAKLESLYESDNGFDQTKMDELVRSALLMGFEVKITDAKGNRITDTKSALARTRPLALRRLAMAAERLSTAEGEFVPHPLFLAGSEIGTIELRFIAEGKKAVFLERAGGFFIVGLLVALLGTSILVIWVWRLFDRPLDELVNASKRIEAGNFGHRIHSNRTDEFGAVAHAYDSMAAALEERESIRSFAIARLAHELRTPLAVMQGELEAMQDGVIEVSADRMASLSEEVERLKKMAGGIEDLYRVENNSVRPSLEPVSLMSIAQAVADRFEAKTLTGNVKIHVSGQETTVEADRSAVTQIVTNLVSNAVNATKEGSITITTGMNESGAFISVKDTGKGIPANRMGMIFDSFYGDTAGGLGLGLAIVKAIADKNGYKIDVASREGIGSVFTLHHFCSPV